jgi:hypothetical protein
VATSEASYIISTPAFRFLVAIDIEDFSKLSVAEQANIIIKRIRYVSYLYSTDLMRLAACHTGR